MGWVWEGEREGQAEGWAGEEGQGGEGKEGERGELGGKGAWPGQSKAWAGRWE